MYKIIFHYTDGSHDETYAGGSFVFSGEKYAMLNDRKPKLFKSEKVARNAAEKLLGSCVNTGVAYTIVEQEG